MQIRKFVGAIRLAAGLGAVVALGFSVQAASAHVASAPLTSPPSAEVTSLSPECLAALQDVRTAIVSDRQADAEEGAGADAAEDASERAQIKQLIAELRSACSAQIAAIKPTITSTRPAVSGQCTAAVQAWKTYAKSLWAQGTAPTAAQQSQLRQLGQAVRTACGWPGGEWPTGGWSSRR